MVFEKFHRMVKLLGVELGRTALTAASSTLNSKAFRTFFEMNLLPFLNTGIVIRCKSLYCLTVLFLPSVS